MSEDIEIAVEVKARTDLAILVSDGKTEEWIPKSQISDYTGEDVDQATTIFIPEYLALKKGFI